VTHGTHLLPRVFGGEQERKLRPGTEALPLIAGFGAAVRALPPLTESMAHAEALRTELLTQLAEFGDHITVNSAPDALPYVVNFSVTGKRSETILHHLAARGVYVSSGSACARGHKSHVLTAMQLPPERIDSAVRVSVGHASNEEDIEQLITALKEGLATLTHRH
jgi:cysteine desulfurase